MNTYRQLAVATLVASIICGALVTRAYAESVTIQGNGSGSNNSVKIQDSSSSENTQSNQSNIQNQGSANANTGGNTTTGGSITTGDSTTQIKITTGGNSNESTQGCCTTPTQTPPKSPTGTPVPPIGGGGSNPPTSGGTGGPSSSTSGSGQVLGLSATGSISWDQVVRIIGIALITGASVFLSQKGARFS
jgi:hypothetical protein